MADLRDDEAIRRAAFAWLERECTPEGAITRDRLRTGFRWEGHRIRLVGPKGIFKPGPMLLPLSITTLPGGPYDDVLGYDGLLEYRYRGEDPDHPDNRGLRECWRRRIPLVHFLRLVPGAYLATWPVLVASDQPERLTFRIDLEPAITGLAVATTAGVSEPLAGRRYTVVRIRQRLHQAAFRERVLHAYRERCAICALRHRELLDAAHIIPDAEPEGDPEVRNGLALCRLHHAAFDRLFIAVRPEDYRVVVRRDILEEEDGPMLVHGLQAMHGRRILLPRRAGDRPDRERLAERYGRFLEATP